MPRFVGYLCMGLGLVPLIWLASLRRGGQRFPSAWWWLASAYAVSFLADTAVLAGWSRWLLVSATYPVSQAGILGLVLLTSTDAARFFVALVLAASLGSMFPPDLATIPLRVVAFGAVTVLAWRRPDLGLLRWALVVSFGLGTLGWWGFIANPSVQTWALHQATRLAGTLLFCWAALAPRPMLTWR